MKHGLAWHGVVLLAAILLCTGCDSAKDVLRTPEDRINGAFPITAELATARSRLEELARAQGDAGVAFQNEFQDKLKLRVLTCAAGVRPGIFDSTDEIRQQLPKAQCFLDFDAELAHSLNLQRTALLLAAAPLRPIPERPPAIITASHPIITANFAENAGVALVAASQALEVIDLGSDKSIYLDPGPRSHMFRATLSPNGRVFAAVSQRSGDEGVMLRASETGEVLVELRDFQNFEWLDSFTAWVTKRGTAGSALFDVRTGKAAPLKGIGSTPTQILRVSTTEPIFVARSHQMITRFVLRQSDGEPQINLLSQQPTPSMDWSASISAMTLDGAFLVQGSGKLAISDLQKMQTETIPLDPFSVQSISPLPDPRELLLSVPLPTGSWSRTKLYVFNLNDRTFAPLESEQLVSVAGHSSRTVHIRSLGAVGFIAGSTVRLMTDVKRGLKVGVQPFLQQLQEQNDALRAEMADARQRAYPYDRLPSSLGEPTAYRATGGLQETAKDAQIEGVGVYESSLASGRPGRPSSRGAVHVVVRNSPRPIVLVLTSYEPVEWRLHIEPRTQLKAILVSSYGDSTVTGADAVKTVNIGRTYAYEQSSSGFAALQREVVRWTGKPIGTFQGTYKAANFTVGGTG